MANSRKPPCPPEDDRRADRPSAAAGSQVSRGASPADPRARLTALERQPHFRGVAGGADDGAPARIAVAFSGGLDSSVLLDAAHAVFGPARLIALHVHHGLSPHADAWQRHCEDVAQGYGVLFDAQRVDVAAAGRGIEAAARELRYRALQAMSSRAEASVLFTAHHADDQAETVLLQLLRGAGLPGLSAMPEQDRLANGLLRMRPLLQASRAELAAYARERGLRWIDDESNHSPRFTRNRLRQRLMPELAEAFPAYRSTLARAARHAAQAQSLLEDLAELDLCEVARPDPQAGDGQAERQVLDLDALRRLRPARQANLLRAWLRLLGMPAMSEARLWQTQEQLARAVADNAIAIEHAGRSLRCYRRRVFWAARPSSRATLSTTTSEPAAQVSTFRYPFGDRTATVWRLPEWGGELAFIVVDETGKPSGEIEDFGAEKLATCDALGVIDESALLDVTLAACRRHGGERMRVHPARPRKSLKHLFQESGVPSWSRELPLIFAGKRLLYVPGLGTDVDTCAALALAAAPGQAARGGRRILLRWRVSPRWDRSGAEAGPKRCRGQDKS